jgi:hypothetical protein
MKKLIYIYPCSEGNYNSYTSSTTTEAITTTVSMPRWNQKYINAIFGNIIFDNVFLKYIVRRLYSSGKAI